MSAETLRQVWLGALKPVDGAAASDTEQLKKALSSFAALFDTPADLVKEALMPIATMLKRQSQPKLYDDVLLAFAAATPHTSARAWALVNVGDSKFDADDFDGALQFLSQARDLFRELEDAEGLAKSLIHLADLVRLSNPVAFTEFDVAVVSRRKVDAVDVGSHPITLYKEALSLSRNPTRRQRAYLSLANMYLMSNQLDEAVLACREALAISALPSDITTRRWIIAQSLDLASSLKQRAMTAEAQDIAIACRELCDAFEVGESWQAGFYQQISDIMRGSGK